MPSHPDDPPTWQESGLSSDRTEESSESPVIRLLLIDQHANTILFNQYSSPNAFLEVNMASTDHSLHDHSPVFKLVVLDCPLENKARLSHVSLRSKIDFFCALFR